MAKKATLLILVLLAMQSQAMTVANYRGVYSVDEIDIREVIFARLRAMEKSGELEARKRQMIESVSKHILRPTPIKMPVTSTPEIHYISPEVIVSEDIVTPQGEVLAKRGTKINPFKTIDYNKALIFFDADDRRQVKWVKAHYRSYHQVKFILTGGSIREGNRLFGRVYFDLKGVLSERFGLRHVPSVVTQSGDRWKIEEGAIL